MGKAFDVIVVGARCAGSTTAMLLARKGYRVLAVDHSFFPSDTVSTHILHPLGVGALSRWGLLDRLVATGCPPIHTYAFDFGAFTIAGAPGTDENPVAYCPRRTILDKLLVDAAAESGAEIREGFAVEEIIIEGERAVGIKGRSKRGGSVTEYAHVIVGADGRHSMVSKAVQAEQYREKPRLLAGYYSYWSGLPMSGRFESYIRDRRAFAVVPTHDDLTLVVAGWPYAEFAENRKDIEGNYLKAIELAPEFARRLRSAARVAPFAGTAVPNYFASHTVRAGLWWGTPATTKTLLPHREFSMPFATPSSARMRSISLSRGRCHSTTRWLNINESATSGAGRCTISLANSQRSSLRHPSCSSCFRRHTAIRRPWTDLRV